MTKRIGFCCKWIDTADQINGYKPNDAARQLTTGTTTITWLNRQSRAQAEQRLWDLMVNNIRSTKLLLERVSTLENHFKMVRLSSDILPAYTEPTYCSFYRRPDVINYCEREFAIVGNFARANDIRVSFHPGQFCCIVSDNDNIVTKSILELEYHADMARWMGYGKTFQDFKINVHLSGRLGVDGFDSAWHRMSPELRNCLTLENDEYQQTINNLIALKDKVAIVLDIHHHFISDHEYISALDDRITHIIDSWRGVRPVIHYSVSREDVLVGHCPDTRPDYAALLASGHRKQKLRAHSNFYWNTAVNEWALGFLDNFDIMAESKGKNLASQALYRQLIS
jgi:UV DNA damage repair endonuclease